jgi:hypothetical protein
MKSTEIDSNPTQFTLFKKIIEYMSIVTIDITINLK